MNNTNFVTLNKTRFYVDQETFEKIKKTKSNLKIIVDPIKGKHPKGVYIIPYSTALCFIESKRGTFNWDNHHNFHQDGIPRTLKHCFTSL